MRRTKPSLALWLLPFATGSIGVSVWAQAPVSSPGFSVAGGLHDARVAHTATLLNDGRVLVAGGGSRELASIDRGREMVQVRRTLQGSPRQVLHPEGRGCCTRSPRGWAKPTET
jgi:hypothetical protein